jgi:two-component system alkaline phosphatase synthesis response regulator PhoP
MSQEILVIEDMELVVLAIKENLEREGFQVLTAMNGQDGLRAVTEHKPDLVILDLILPDMDGLEICRKIRKNPEVARVPILILSGKAEEVDKVVGLAVGADDYMSKPFSDKELVARVKALLRRASASPESKMLRVGAIELDPERYTVYVAGNPIALTSREFELLKALLEAKGRALTRDHFLETVWGFDRAVSVETRTVDVHIKSLRSKLGPEGRRILTVRNVGYRCDSSPEGPAQSLTSD